MLSMAQKRHLQEFYELPPVRVVLDKRERDEIWSRFIVNREEFDSADLEQRCPALFREIQKAVETGHNVQSAVASECAYAQSLANLYQLNVFSVFDGSSTNVPPALLDSLKTMGLSPRYVYGAHDGNRFLIQAGGFAGVDSALVSVTDDEIFTIEFKEPWAKTSEPDLPPYGEDGLMAVSESFLSNNPQFGRMISEQLSQNLNFFEHIGNNINTFSSEGIEFAVLENYQGAKNANAICTEDVNGILSMIPANQVNLWATLEGEIRPAGRNHYNVWTPKRLEMIIRDLGGVTEGRRVTVEVSVLKPVKPRGGVGVSRFKLDSVFFIKAAEVEINGGHASFDIDRVRQLRPTITAKMSFKRLNFEETRKFYSDGSI
jgi:hypothetical protein